MKRTVKCLSKKKIRTFPYGVNEITFYEWNSFENLSLILILLLILTLFFILKIQCKARCRNKVSFWLSLRKVLNEWMKQRFSTMICIRIWKEITENAMKDEIELHIGLCCCWCCWCWQNGISCKLLHCNQYFFSHSISLQSCRCWIFVFHRRLPNALFSIVVPFLTFWIWMDANLNSYVWCMWMA